MTSENPTFNLLECPWIRVRDLDGHIEERSILDTLSKSHQVRALAGEIPTQDVAVLRMLLAILLRSLRPDKQTPVDDLVDLWADWWQDGRLPMEAVEPYCRRHAHRFDLFDPTAPFLQVAGLTTQSGNRSGLTKLITEIPDGHQFFTTRAGSGVTSLSWPEAARWLVHCQAFDPAGIKTGAIGDSRVKGGKGYSMGYPAWAGNLGLIVVEGANLFETLLLNLPLAMAAESVDLPVWERPPLTSAVDESHPVPTGPADILTWPSRRLLLITEGDRVTDVQVSNGDRLGPQNLFGVEPMTAWHHSGPQSKKAKEDVWMPVTHRPERRLWQGLGATLATDDKARGRRPFTLDWLARLTYEEVLDPDRPVRVRACGLEYGTQNAVVAGAIDDSLGAHARALTDEVLMATAVDASTRAQAGVQALAKLASNLAQAAGEDQEAPRADAFELGYSILDGPYRKWLSALKDPAVAVEALQDWGEQARTLLLRCGRQMCADAGPAALQGRQVEQYGREGTLQLDAALAEIWFRAALNSTLVPHLSTSDKEPA